MRKYLRSMCAVLAVLMCCVFVPPAFAAVPEEVDVAREHTCRGELERVTAVRYNYYSNDEHIRIQTGEYRCTICGRLFSRTIETPLKHRLQNGSGKFQYTTIGPNGETLYVYVKQCVDCGGNVTFSTTTPPN